MVLIRTQTLTFRLGSVIDEGDAVKFYSPKSHILVREYNFKQSTHLQKYALLEAIAHIVSTPSITTTETIVDLDDNGFINQGVYIKNYSRDAVPMRKNSQTFMFYQGHLIALKDVFIRVSKNKSVTQGEFFSAYLNTPRGVPVMVSFIAPYNIANVEDYLNKLVFGANYRDTRFEYRSFYFDHLLQSLEQGGWSVFVNTI